MSGLRVWRLVWQACLGVASGHLGLVCALMMGCASSDESEGGFDVRLLQPPPAAAGPPAACHGFNWNSEDSSGDALAESDDQQRQAALDVSSRGRYSRSTTAQKQRHADQARQYQLAVETSALAGVCSCTRKCPDRLHRNDMYQCIEFSYGTISFVTDDALKISKRQSGIAYGKATQFEETAGRWQTTRMSQETGDAWAELFDTFVTFGPDGSRTEVYRAAGYDACAQFTRNVYGIPEGTWLCGMANARKQPGGAVIAREEKGAGASTVRVDAMGGINSTSEAVDWWKNLMLEWDMIPNESPPVIKHPAYVAEALYAQVYVPEMQLYSYAKPLQQKDGKAPSSWLRARDAAVRQISLDEFGLKEETTTGEPRLTFRLVERPNHSNFAECSDCRSNRLEKEGNIRNRAPRATRDATSAKQVAHVRECHAERNVTAEWVREAGRSTTLLAENDDKLGSWWNFLPMPPGGRFGKQTANKWRYKQCIMANLFPGFGNFYSLVPPFLMTGNNFGCTAFCVALCRLIRSNRLPASVTTFTRQTDGGSDCDGKTTHGLHYVLVREGACNRLLWGRLRTGHSHSWPDLTFAEAKTLFYPRDGVGPGCSSPMEYHAALTDGLKKLPGGMEIMWQLANFEFDAFVSSFMDRNQFTHAQEERLWCYEYAPELDDLYVRCTFKTLLTDKATSHKAEWKPHLRPSQSGIAPPPLFAAARPPPSWPHSHQKPLHSLHRAGWQETDPEGLVFVKKDDDDQYAQPNFAYPGLDPWVKATEEDASGWERDKVFKDVRETGRVENFSAEQMAEWEALFEFHTRFQTPESLPMAPHKLTTSSGKSITMHGMPISWTEMWTTLRRLPRPHLATTPAPCTAVAAAAAPTTRAPSRGVASSSSIEKGHALQNNVTGTNHPKRARDKDAETYKMQVEVSKMEMSRSNLEVKQLYFIALPEFEGELSVGLGRVTACTMAESSVVGAKVEWLARRGWSNDPKATGFVWAVSPMFDAYMESGRVATNEHPIADFLPIDVKLTDGSTHLENFSLRHKSQRFCVKYDCVTELREFCTRHRPDLVNPAATSKAQGKRRVL